MSDQWGTREQRPDPPRTEYGYLAVGIAALTTSLLLCAGSYQGLITVGTGVFSILAAMTVVCGVGWIVRSGDTKRRRDLAEAGKQLRAGQVEVHNRLAELTSQIDGLRKQVDRYRCPSQPTYLSAVVGNQSDTVPLLPTVDADAEAALRRISMKLLKGGTDQG